MEFKESKCIGCGCTDSRACIEPDSGNACSWLRVDRQSGSGVCSCCKQYVDRWDEGIRTSGKPKADITIAGDAVFAGVDEDDAQEIRLAMVVQFKSQAEYAEALRTGLIHASPWSTS